MYILHFRRKVLKSGASIRHIEIRKGRLGPSIRVLPTNILNFRCSCRVGYSPQRLNDARHDVKCAGRTLGQFPQAVTNTQNPGILVEFNHVVPCKITGTKLIFILASSSNYRLISLIILNQTGCIMCKLQTKS